MSDNASVDTLSRQQILAALQLLARELPTGHPPREIVVVGGAALVLLYDAREATKDVDAVIVDRSVLEAARRVAGHLSLPDDWLNDAAKGYLQGNSIGPVLFTSDTLLVRTLAAHHLLAMKLSSWRDDGDNYDARLLLSHLAGDMDAVWALVEPHLLPGRELKARYAFEDLWEVLRGSP
jgi:hypothetical protein